VAEGSTGSEGSESTTQETEHEAEADPDREAVDFSAGMLQKGVFFFVVVGVVVSWWRMRNRVDNSHAKYPV